VKSAIPQDLAAHFRYPEDQFKVQRDLLTRYHVTNPQDFFLRSGLLAGAQRSRPGESCLKQPPYYLLAQFPVQDQQSPDVQLTAA